jgi:CRISPR-associated protein Cmr5
MQTRDQKYAARAFAQVSGVLEKDWKKKYGSMAHKLPVLVRSAGLAQALGFVEARGEEPQKRLLEHLAQTVGAGTKDDLLNRSRTASLPEYMRLTREVMAALQWYKRFAQSVLEVETGEEGGTP